MAKIHDEKTYYTFLEGLRNSGVCEMFDAPEYMLVRFKELTKVEATEILLNWLNACLEADI
jgi:hypothetical protein